MRSIAAALAAVSLAVLAGSAFAQQPRLFEPSPLVSPLPGIPDLGGNDVSNLGRNDVSRMLGNPQPRPLPGPYWESDPLFIPFPQ